MKKWSIFLVLIVNISFGQEYDPVFSYDFEFKHNSKQVLFANNVNLRKSPSTTDEVLSVLPMGMAIHILKKTDLNITINNISWAWYQVKAGNQLGYIPGAFIALREENLGGNRFYFGVKKDERERVSAIIREQKIDSTYNEWVQEIPVYSFGIVVTDGRGVEGVENILYVDYYAEACGYDGGGAYYFHTGEELIKVAELTQVGDGGVFWYDEHFIFPEDSLGQLGVVKYYEEEGQAVEEEPWWEESTIKIRHLKWTGTGFYPSIEAVQKREDQ